MASTGTPFKGKLGVPVWFSGKVSPAFHDHLFWPSPPKKVAKKSQKEIFPACCSTAKWRQLYRERTVSKSCSDKKAENSGKRKKTSLSKKTKAEQAALSPAAEPPSEVVQHEAEVMHKNTLKQTKKTDRSGCTSSKNRRSAKISGDSAASSSGQVDDTQCLYCEVKYCDSQVNWLRCGHCLRWACCNCARAGKRRYVCDTCK